MQGGIVLAWLTGIGIVSWRSVKQDHHPPLPGQLLGTSFIFIMLGVLSQAERARFLASALAWGFDIAALMNVLPQVVSGSSQTPKPITAIPGQDLLSPKTEKRAPA